MHTADLKRRIEESPLRLVNFVRKQEHKMVLKRGDARHLRALEYLRLAAASGSFVLKDDKGEDKFS